MLHSPCFGLQFIITRVEFCFCLILFWSLKTLNNCLKIGQEKKWSKNLQQEVCYSPQLLLLLSGWLLELEIYYLDTLLFSQSPSSLVSSFFILFFPNLSNYFLIANFFSLSIYVFSFIRFICDLFALRKKMLSNFITFLLFFVLQVVIKSTR